jgi:hypothetical protein
MNIQMDTVAYEITSSVEGRTATCVSGHRNTTKDNKLSDKLGKAPTLSHLHAKQLRRILYLLLYLVPPSVHEPQM